TGPTAAPPPPPPRAKLRDRDDYTDFEGAAPAATTVADLSAVLGSVGRLDAEGEDVEAAHVRVDVGWLRETAHAEGADATWDEQFEGMLAHAETRGWVQDGTVRAHVVTV
ncbi:hypothetical protein, partial [Kineococcus sp. SYSU DK001]|uniref:hypothetical protein n=1 Tax=Kineococcus sp. SYSU DK001 TaxID=3383122 RepID=UPI003D7ECC15